MAQSQERSTGRVVLARAKEIVGTGHPWIYAGFIQSVSGNPSGGDIVDVQFPDGRLYAKGFFNPLSKIRVRILSFLDEPIGESFWRGRIAQAYRLRRKVVEGSNAYRLVYGEADQLPGLIVDRYDDVFVMQTLSIGMDCRQELLGRLLAEETGVGRIFLRNDAKSRALEGLQQETKFLRGSGTTLVRIAENPATFEVDIQRGQKTGWFCDQRENRLAAAKLADGAEVLEVFCHTGAFGIQAALAGAKTVEGLDVSLDALAMARQHAALNHVEARCLYRQADAFEEMRQLERQGRRYDLVILDPPAFARSKQAVPRALAGYKDVNLLGMRLTRPEGFLVTSSCSHHVSDEALWGAITRAGMDAKRTIRLLEKRGQASDHPVLGAMPETHYLKCFILQIL